MIRSLVILALVPVFAFAQWPGDTSTGFPIANAGSEQVGPKIRTDADGNSYVCWLDNKNGGYDTYVQKLDWSGNEQWAHDGVLVADTAFSSTQDYGFTVGRDGNAYVCYRDAANGISVQKISPSGSLLWGSGISVTTGSGSFNSPKITVQENGQIVAGWSTSTGFSLRRVNPNGTLAGTELAHAETGHAITLSDITFGDNGTVIALWTRGFTTNFMSSKYLYAQKYDELNVALWNGATPTKVYAPTGSPYGSQGGSVQNGTFPTMTPDFEGGFVIAWYENAGPRQAYVQHVGPDGIPKFGGFTANTGPAVQVDATRIALGASLAYDPWTRSYFVACATSLASPQGTYKVVAQKFDKTGTPQWGAGAVEVMPNNTFQKSFVQCAMSGNGLSVFGFDARSGTTGVVFSAGVDPTGALLFGNPVETQVYSVNSGKARLDSVLGPQGDALMVWTDGGTGSGDVFGARMWGSGAVGNGTHRVTGTINADDYVGYLPYLTWNVVVRQGATTEPHLVRTNALGEFSFDTNLTGAANVEIKGPHWLRRVVPVADLSTASMAVSVINGDSIPDNVIDLSDYTDVVVAFNATPYDANWSTNADLNGDRVVDLTDYTILVVNFNSVGE
ncbi:MAG: hypothetical protein K8R88_12255 [Armatimonadetes bacterium]|nr:hypothetical protein [Armatimonadota bacterium]